MTHAHKIDVQTDGQPGHYFASSVAEWKIGADVNKLVEHMRREPFPFSVWFVPLPDTAAYEIDNCRPVVEGAIKLATEQLNEDS
jgi:hypothetical protein